MRWLSERSGATELPAGVERVAVVMGGESTHQRDAIKAKSPNSPVPQVEVEYCRACWTVSHRPHRGGNVDLRRVLGLFHKFAASTARPRRAGGGDSAPPRPISPAPARIPLRHARPGCPPPGPAN